MDRHRIAVVVPALNEERTVGQVVEGVWPWAMPIVVDDGSTDSTATVAEAAGALVVHHPEPKGYDRAIEAGFRAAAGSGCDYVVTMDADGQHPAEALPEFARAFDEGADVVVGIRPDRQRIGEVIFAGAARMLWGMQDPLCGMKGYRLDIFTDRGCFDSYGSIGTELAIFAISRGKRMLQVPVPTAPRLDGSRFGRSLSANFRILRALAISIWRYGARADQPGPSK